MNTQEWIDAVCYQKSDGNFKVVNTLEEAKSNGDFIDGVTRFQHVKVKYNKGQPIIDFGNFEASVVDFDSKK